MSDAMRERIAGIIRQTLPLSSYDEMYIPECVDTIIAALPDMVPDLVWEDWTETGEISSDCVTGAEYATAPSFCRPGLWRLRLPWGKSTFHNSKEAAKSAANAHHRAQIMKALGIGASHD